MIFFPWPYLCPKGASNSVCPSIAFFTHFLASFSSLQYKRKNYQCGSQSLRCGWTSSSIFSPPESHVSCGYCSHVVTTPKGPRYKLDILMWLAAQARSLGSVHRLHLCWNGEKPKLHAPLQVLIKFHFMGVLGVCSAFTRIIFCFYLTFFSV